MKTKITALALLAVTALSLAPKPAQASDKTLAVLGGFLGGVIIASEINRHHDYDTAPVVVVNDRCDDRDGYWKTVEVRVWVPGIWVTERRHGCSFSRYIGGHYECRNDREWVSYSRHDRHDRSDRDDRYDRYDRYDREVGYGYGHRR